jgi:hypothetical protein
MTFSELNQKLEIFGLHEFDFENQSYMIKVEKNAMNKLVYYFGHSNLPKQEFENFTDLMANGRIEGRYLKELFPNI